MKKTIALILTLCFSIYISGQDVAIFNGEGGDDKWDNPKNWSTQQVPDENTTAIIPEAYTVKGPRSGNNGVAAIENSGTIELRSGVVIYTDRLDNIGTIKAHNNTIMSSDLSPRKLIVNNTGEIIGSGSYSETGSITFSGINTFSNAGKIEIYSFYLNGKGAFMNTPDGEIFTTACINFTIPSFTNHGIINAHHDCRFETEAFENNGLLSSNLSDIHIIVTEGYFREGHQSRIRLSEDKNIFINGKRGDITGKISCIEYKFRKITQIMTNDSEIEIAIDTCWIVGDSAEIKGETIHFLFDYLCFIQIDSIKDIYANSNIKFYGAAGSTLNLWNNDAEDFIYSENGSIEIHTDSIILPKGYDINYFCYPDPVVGPSDTTYLNSYIGSNYVMDSAGSSGDIKLNCRNNSTGHRSFDYTISSQLGWITTTTGNTQNLVPFQFDSLMIDYNIPFSGDTLTDTMMVVFSIPGEYADTSYSYIRSFPGITTNVIEPIAFNKELTLEVTPNPSSGPVSIKTSENSIMYITDLKGRIIDDFPLMKDIEHVWNSETRLAPGIYLINAFAGKNQKTIKLIFR